MVKSNLAENGEAANEWVDPRIRRTRQLLLDALGRLLESKSFEQISVGDIAAEATVNRATFYDHYTDKFALLEGLVEARFQHLLEKRHVVFDASCSSAMENMALVMCDYLAGLTNRGCPERGQMEKYFESAMISVVRRMILHGVREHNHPAAVAPELLASTLSGALYGAAREWVCMPNRQPAGEIAKVIVKLVSPIFSSAGEMRLASASDSAG